MALLVGAGGTLRAPEAGAVAPSTAAQSQVLPSQNTGALVAAPGPNPSYAENAAGEYNFNGNSGDSAEATGFYPTLAAAEANWQSLYGAMQPSTGLAAVADQGPTGTTGLPVTSPVAGTTFPTLPSLASSAVVATSPAVEASSASTSTTGAANQTGISTPSDAAAAELSAALSGGGDAGDDVDTTGVPGSGSIAGMVPVASSTDTTSSSGPSVAIIAIIVVAVVAIVGYFLWKKYGHKAAGAVRNGNAA